MVGGFFLCVFVFLSVVLGGVVVKGVFGFSNCAEHCAPLPTMPPDPVQGPQLHEYPHTGTRQTRGARGTLNKEKHHGCSGAAPVFQIREIEIPTHHPTAETRDSQKTTGERRGLSLAAHFGVAGSLHIARNGSDDKKTLHRANNRTHSPLHTKRAIHRVPPHHVRGQRDHTRHAQHAKGRPASGGQTGQTGQDRGVLSSS